MSDRMDIERAGFPGPDGPAPLSPIALDATGTSQCPYCEVASPHSHDRCPTCRTPAVEVDVEGEWCQCRKKDGRSIHGHAWYPVAESVDMKSGACWGCKKLPQPKQWVPLPALVARVAQEEREKVWKEVVAYWDATMYPKYKGTADDPIRPDFAGEKQKRANAFKVWLDSHLRGAP